MRNVGKLLLIAMIICSLLLFVACPNGQNGNSDGERNDDTQNGSGGQGDEKSEVATMKITIGSKEFSATLCDNATAKAFAELLPTTLNMRELNGNEKYNYLSTTLPTNSEHVGNINAGDVMLYGNDCVVLFYKSFSTGYSYTRIGKIDDVTGLQQAVGSGSVAVTFQIK